MATQLETRGAARREAIRTEARTASAISWSYVILGAMWLVFGGFVLSYRPGSVAAVAALVGCAFTLGGVAQLVVASRVTSWRWPFILSGTLGIVAGVVTFAWPGITLYVLSVFLAWYLIVFGVVHIVNALAGPKLPWWWTGLLLGLGELVLGVWAVHTWQASLLTLVTLVGVWAICLGVDEIFAGFSIHEAATRTQELLDR